MDIHQKKLLGIFFSMTAFILILDHLFPGEKFVNYIKHATIIALLFFALMVPKKNPEKVIMCVALFFTVVGDFLLNFCAIFPGIVQKFFPYGVLSFSIAYLLLIIALQKNIMPSWREIISAIPVLAVIGPTFIVLSPYIPAEIVYGSLLFSFVLAYMATISISTLFKGYFSKNVSIRIALAGFLILISDMGVAVEQFIPTYINNFTPWLKNIIWGTFIPAWTLILVNIAENNFLSYKKIDVLRRRGFLKS